MSAREQRSRCRERGPHLWLGERGNGFSRKIMDADWADNVSNALLTAIRKGQSQPVADLIVHSPRYAYPARLRQGFEPSRDVDGITVEILIVYDHIAEVDADAEPNAPVVRNIGIALDHALLHLDGPAHRFDRAGKLDQDAIARSLDDTAAVPGNARIDQVAPARL
jgi:hypothetical protein